MIAITTKRHERADEYIEQTRIKIASQPLRLPLIAFPLARRWLFNTKQQEVIDITVDETFHTKVRLVNFGGCPVFTDLWYYVS